MRRATLLVLPLLAAPSLAQAASFSCAKASTPTEKAICVDQGLSKLDERVAAAYRDALALLSGSSPEEARAQIALKADQRGWLGERNACGADLSCLRAAHERRVAVLTFHPDPGGASNASRPADWPADRYVGRFDHDGFMSIAALALRNGQLAVSVSGAEPSAGRWVCDFSGIGQVDGKGRLIVGTPDAAGNGLILEARGSTTDKTGIDIPDNEPNRAASGNWCGMNGSFILSYTRAP